jgi:nitrogen fixation protein NifB
MPLDLTRHPCFNEHAKQTAARIHLPVAPRCNMQCNYCKHGLDCVNESRPGLTSAVLSPGQALRYLERMVQKDPRITVTGIAGPGDPFANAEATMETLRLVRGRFPEMLLCVASNGLGVAPYAGQLAAVGVSHVTLTVNAVDPRIGQAIYAWVREEPRVYRGLAAAELLLDRQLAAVAALKTRGVTVKINSIIIPGINDAHIPEVARRMAELGADIVNCVPLYAVEGTPLAELSAPTAGQIASIRQAAARFLPVMAHCTRCRADAVGLLGEPLAADAVALLTQCAELPANPEEDRPYVAVATREGVLVNQHLGEASQLAIYGRKEAWEEDGDAARKGTVPFSRPGFRHVATRPTPSAGGGPQRWAALADTLKDCRALLVASAGASPTSALAARGIRVVMMEGLIEEGLEAVYNRVEVRAPLRAEHRCGSGCAGGGTGCS